MPRKRWRTDKRKYKEAETQGERKMEERIIDDEYGRGIRLKKTKDGYVDVTDELSEKETSEGQEIESGETYADEIAFEFPVLETDEDDEDLVGLTPEQAMELRRKKEEEAAQRKADYERACKEGDELLQSGSFKAAELKFEKALSLDDIATDASVGYWRAKTSDFTEPEILLDEYVDAGIENLEHDLGYEATMRIRKEYKLVFENKMNELKAEEKPLAQEVESKQTERREILSARLKKAMAYFIGVALPTIALFILTIVIGLKNVTTREDTFVLPTILLGCGFVLFFVAFMVVANKLFNVLRMRRANEKLSSTQDGARLLRLREYKELCESLLQDEE
jgi:hypothetical protein